MATSALLRSVRRREVVSGPLSALKSRAALGESSLGSSYLAQNYASLCRIFSSKTVVNDFGGTGLSTITPNDAIKEEKNPKAFQNAAGSRMIPFAAFSGKQELLSGASSFGSRHSFSTKSDDLKTEEGQNSPKTQSFRPLSPHLPVYQPQMNSMLSIFNRISGAYLSGVVLAGYLVYMKMGMICLTYPSFYQFIFHVSKQMPFFISMTAIATLYHIVKSTHSLMTHSKPFPKLF